MAGQTCRKFAAIAPGRYNLRMLQPGHLPAARLDRGNLGRIAAFLILAVAGYYLLRSEDVDLVRWRYKVMPTRQPDMLLQTLSSFRAVGQYLMIPLVAILVISYDQRWRMIL